MNARELIDQIRAAQGKELEQLVSRYGEDPRQGVQHALMRAQAREQARATEQKRLGGLYTLLDEAAPGEVLVGLDEVGRGALAGPLVVAAVCLPAQPRIEGLNDSKQLSPSKREQLAGQINALARAVGIAQVEATAIDADGMAVALRRAMLQALEQTGLEADQVLIDGLPLHIHPRELTIVHGDARIAPIAAASIVAKVYRDELMRKLDSQYPGFEWSGNKGYGSAGHIAAIRKLGLSPEHRMSFLTGILGAQETLF